CRPDPSVLDVVAAQDSTGYRRQRQPQPPPPQPGQRRAGRQTGALQPPCSSSAYGPSFQKCHRHQPRANTPNDGQMLPVANATMPQAQANKTMERAVRMSHTISENVSPLPFRISPQISSTAKEPRAGTAHFTQPAGVIRCPAA